MACWQARFRHDWVYRSKKKRIFWQDYCLQEPRLSRCCSEDDRCFFLVFSGNRSAIIRGSDSRFYRLKGCGNYVNAVGLRYPFPGFPIEIIENAVSLRFFQALSIFSTVVVVLPDGFAGTGRRWGQFVCPYMLPCALLCDEAKWLCGGWPQILL